MMRPRGRPPTPSARSIARDPVETVSTFILALLPRRMIEPSPNCLVIEDSASSMFLSRAWGAGAGAEGLASAAFWGGALDMAETEALVDALILNRRDSKIPRPPRFWRRPARGRAAAGRRSRGAPAPQGPPPSARGAAHAPAGRPPARRSSRTG